MSQTIPDPPYKVPLTDQSGLMNMTWAGWIRQAFTRIGGNQALSNIELEDLQAADLETLRTDVANLQSTATSLQSQLDVLADDFGVEPVA